MQPDTENLTHTTELSDATIGPTLPRLEVQVVNITTERDNQQRRIESIMAELNDPSLTEEARMEALEDLSFAEGKLAEAQSKLDQLTLERDGAAVSQTGEAAAEIPSSDTVDALTAEAVTIAEQMTESSSESTPQA